MRYLPHTDTGNAAKPVIVREATEDPNRVLAALCHTRLRRLDEILTTRKPRIT